MNHHSSSESSEDEEIDEFPSDYGDNIGDSNAHSPPPFNDTFLDDYNSSFNSFSIQSCEMNFNPYIHDNSTFAKPPNHNSTFLPKVYGQNTIQQDETSAIDDNCTNNSCFTIESSSYASNSEDKQELQPEASKESSNFQMVIDNPNYHLQENNLAPVSDGPYQEDLDVSDKENPEDTEQDHPPKKRSRTESNWEKIIFFLHIY